MIVNKEIQSLAKEQGIDYEIGDLLVLEKNSPKRQIQKLIWDYVTFIKITVYPKWTVEGLLSIIMIDSGFSTKGVVKRYLNDDDDEDKDREYEYVNCEFRKSLALSKNSKSSYLAIMEALKEHHLHKDSKGYFEYLDRIQNK